MSFLRAPFISNTGATYNTIVSKAWIKMKGYVTFLVETLMTVLVFGIHSITIKQDITNTPYN